MGSHESPISYLDQVSLNRLADKKALDSYLRKQKEPAGDVRFLMTEKLRESVRELVKGLTPAEERLVRLRFWDDMSVEEIAESLELAVDDAQGQLTKVLAKLRGRILNKCQQHLERSPGARHSLVDSRDVAHT